jgi:hypothetical protein
MKNCTLKYDFQRLLRKVDFRVHVVTSEVKRKKKVSFAELVLTTECISV